MRKDGRDLQKLIAAIERAKAYGRTDLKIESPAYRLDKVTNKQREHDVLLTYTPGHHEVVMALECRDRSRPIGTDAVEAFHTKCENTGIHHGVLVSSHGFTKPALAKAAFYNIRCLSLDAVDSFNWCMAPGLLVTGRHITHTHVYFAFPDGVDTTGQLVLEDGTPVDNDHFRQWSERICKEHPDKISFEPGQHTVSFKMLDPPAFMQLPDKRAQAAFITVTIDYSVKTELAPFSFRRYGDASNAAGISEVAIATMPMGGDKTADFIFSTGDQGILVSIVPNKK